MADYTKEQLESRLRNVIAASQDPNLSEEGRTRAKMIGVKLQETLGKKQYLKRSGIEEFAGNIKNDFKKRKGEAVESFVDYMTGKQGLPETTLQVGGKLGAGTVMDVAGETVGLILPEEYPEWVHKSADWILGTDTAKYIKENWNELSPRAQKNIESSVNIFMLGAPKAKLKPKAQSLITKGHLLRKKRLSNYFIDPKSDTVQGKEALLKRNFQDTVKHVNMIDELDNVKGISPNKTFKANAMILHKELKDSSNKLRNSLESMPTKINREEVSMTLKRELKKLKKEDNFLQSDNAIKNAFNTTLKTVEKSLSSNQSTPAGLLKARQQFDKTLRKSMFDAKIKPPKRAAIDEAAKLMRRTVNEVIDAHSPSTDVKALLNKQHQIYSGLDSLAYQYGQSKDLFAGIAQYATSHPFMSGAAMTGTGIVGNLLKNPIIWGTAGIGAIPYAANRFAPEIMSGAGKAAKYPAGLFDIAPVSPVRGLFYPGEDDANL